jgi:DNA-binding transcriptional LysR family regulator
MKLPRTSIEQWRILQAVVDYGGFAQAAQQLYRSQSAISYTVARLQEQIGVALLEQEGRRMRLTEAGAALLRDAIPLADGLTKLEERALTLQQGWETEIRLAVDSLYPTEPLLKALEQFAGLYTGTRLQLHETVMSGTDEALFNGKVDLAVGGTVPPGFLGDWLLDAEFIAVAAPQHPLHQLGRELNMDDLVEHTQVVVRDSGSREPRDAGWLGAKQRWTVSRVETSIEAVLAGLAFAWLPHHRIVQELDTGMLRPLPLAVGQRRFATLYLIYADPTATGPATRAFGQLLQETTAAWRELCKAGA